MKKKLCMLLLGLCLVSMTACGNKAASDKSDNTLASSYNEKATTDADSNDSAKAETNDDDKYAISGTLQAPDEEPEEDSDVEENNAASKDAENEGTDTNEELVDGMRPEFKEAMDSYETFYNHYCDIMKKYTENPSDVQLLADYIDMLSKGAEMSEKFEAWEDDELNNTELKYYLDVQNRVAQKLLEVSE